MTNNENTELKPPKVKVDFFGTRRVNGYELLQYKVQSGEIENDLIKGVAASQTLDQKEIAKLRELVRLKDEALEYIDNKAYILQREAMPRRALYEVEKIARTAQEALKQIKGE